MHSQTRIATPVTMMDTSHPLSHDTTDQLLSVLSDRHCRFLLSYFSEASEDTAAVDDVANAISRHHSVDEHRAAMGLHHKVLPQLEHLGIVEYDPAARTVRYQGDSRLENWNEYISADANKQSQERPSSVTADGGLRENAVRDTFSPDQNRSLTGAILEAIEECTGTDLTESGFVLYDDIDPTALNQLFRADAHPRTTVTFVTDGVLVELWGGGGVEIRVTERTDQ